MDIASVMDDLGAALDAVDELRVYPYWAARVTPPSVTVGWPEPLTYDSTYRRGSDRATFPVTVLVGKVDARSSRDRLARYADGTGTHSVKAAIEAHAATAYDTAVVRSCSFEVITISGVEYLAGVFEVDVMGPGR